MTELGFHPSRALCFGASPHPSVRAPPSPGFSPSSFLQPPPLAGRIVGGIGVRAGAAPPGTMSGSDTAPFLSQADDTGDGPVPGTPGLPGYVGNPKSENPEVPDRERLQRITGLSASRSALIVAVLCYINLLNYMDRFTVAGTDFWVEVR